MCVLFVWYVNVDSKAAKNEIKNFNYIRLRVGKLYERRYTKRELHHGVFVCNRWFFARSKCKTDLEVVQIICAYMYGFDVCVVCVFDFMCADLCLLVYLCWDIWALVFIVYQSISMCRYTRAHIQNAICIA